MWPYMLASEPRDGLALLQATSSNVFLARVIFATPASSEERNSHMCSALETAAL